MNGIITRVLLTGALGLGVAACSEQSEQEWQGAGEEVGQALEGTGEDIERGAERVAGEAREAVRDDDGHTDHEHEVERAN